MPANKMNEEERRWRAEEDARALRRAEEIRADKARLRDAHAHVKKEIGSMSAVLKSGAPREPRKVSPAPPAPKMREKSIPAKRDMKEMPKPPKAKAK